MQVSFLEVIKFLEAISQMRANKLRKLGEKNKSEW